MWRSYSSPRSPSAFSDSTNARGAESLIASYLMMAIFHASLFVPPESADLMIIYSHTIPATRAILEELVALGE